MNDDVEKMDVAKCAQIAAACAASQEDGAYNTLITMNSTSRDCKLAAVKALGEQGRPAALTQLMYQAKSVGDDAELKNAITVAMELLHKAK